MNIKAGRQEAKPPPTGLLRGASLFLDFDGTLVDIAPTPDAIEVSEGLRALIAMLDRRLQGRVAILSGRPAADLETLIDPVRVAIGGHHGLETRARGTIIRSAKRPAALDLVLVDLRKLEERYPGVFVENKPLGIAVHYRRAPEAEQACREALQKAARDTALAIQPGKMVLELKPCGANKGDALGELMGRPPFRGTRPIFLGDDLTDEPGFEAAQALGGAGIIIGEREPTAATYRLPTVEATIRWLQNAVEAVA